MLQSVCLIVLSLSQPSPIGQFGYCVSLIPDLDGDKLPDLAISDPLWVGVQGGQGRVGLISSRTGVLLDHFDGDQSHARFGAALLLTTEEGGIPAQLLIGAPSFRQNGEMVGAVYSLQLGEARRIRLFARGEQEGELFGYCMRQAGNLTAECAHSILIGCPGFKSKDAIVGRVAGYSLESGKECFDVLGSSATSIGRQVSDIGDVFGRPGIAFASDSYVGSENAFLPTLGSENRLGRCVLPITEQVKGLFPYCVVLQKRTSGNPRLLVSCYVDPGSADARGHIYVIEGGKVIARLDEETLNSGFGTVIYACDDYDADGCPDIVVGTPDDGGVMPRGGFRVYSGAKLTLIGERKGDSPTDSMGSYIAGGFDYDADGVPDIIVSCVNTRSPQPGIRGKVKIISGKNIQQTLRVLESPVETK